MDHLHAYWRMEYVAAPTPEDRDRLFEELPNYKDEKAVHLLWKGAHTYLVMNRYPYNAGHLLAVPFRKVPDISELSEEESADLMRTIVRGKEVLSQAIKPHGFNIGINQGEAAGAGIPGHLHAHIVPRWKGDTNFMPVLGETRVLPESLDRMWERLRAFV